MPFGVGFMRHESPFQIGDVRPQVGRLGVSAKMARSQVARSGVSEQKSKGRFSNAQIVEILRAHEKGTPVPELCRQYSVSPTTFYKWRTKFAGTTWSEPSPEKTRIAALEEENRRLKMLLGETMLENSVLKEMLAKKTSD